MTWDIFLGIVALFGFVVTVVKTILPLTTAVTSLTEQMKEVGEDIKELNQREREKRRELWKHNDAQDKRLDNHAKRLHELDGKWEE